MCRPNRRLPGRTPADCQAIRPGRSRIPPLGDAIVRASAWFRCAYIDPAVAESPISRGYRAASNFVYAVTLHVLLLLLCLARRAEHGRCWRTGISGQLAGAFLLPTGWLCLPPDIVRTPGQPSAPVLHMYRTYCGTAPAFGPSSTYFTSCKRASVPADLASDSPKRGSRRLLHQSFCAVDAVAHTRPDLRLGHLPGPADELSRIPPLPSLAFLAFLALLAVNAFRVSGST